MRNQDIAASNDEPTGFKAIDEAALAAQQAADANTQRSEAALDQAEDLGSQASIVAAEQASGAADLVSDAAEALTDHFEHVAAATEQAWSDTASRAEALASPPQEPKSFAGECLELAKEGAAKQVNAVARLVACRSPQDLLKLQMDLAKEALVGTADAAKRLGAASLRDMATLTQQRVPAQ